MCLTKVVIPDNCSKECCCSDPPKEDTTCKNCFLDFPISVPLNILSPYLDMLRLINDIKVML